MEIFHPFNNQLHTVSFDNYYLLNTRAKYYSITQCIKLLTKTSPTSSFVHYCYCLLFVRLMPRTTGRFRLYGPPAVAISTIARPKLRLTKG